jgi:hypothetical protein
MTTNIDLQRQAIRAAVKIHEHLAGAGRHGEAFDLPQSTCHDLRKTMDRLRWADRKGWHAACRSLVPDVDYVAGRLQREIDFLRQAISTRWSDKRLASASEIAADLIALKEEFEALDVNLQERSITVLTDPVVLEEVYLGPFHIALHWERIGQGRAYVVHAEDPNCPEGHEDVTHPHVQDDQLCEGEGAAAIRAALTSGRLYDFFVLVRQILQTYNGESAHVSLANWDGTISCEGCGTSMSEDDYSTCERCDVRLCGDCSWGCTRCCTYVCSGCSADCSKCGNRFCLACLRTPAGTNQLLCETCLEAQQKDQTDDSKDSPPAEQPATPPPTAEPAAAAPDALCLGQASLPARPRRNGSRALWRQQTERPLTRRRGASRAAAMLAADGEI